MSPTPSAPVPEPCVLTGEISVLAALEARRRKITALYVDRDKPYDEIQDINAAAREAGLRVTRAERADLDRMADGAGHGGIVAQAGDRQYQSLDGLAPATGSEWYVFLEGIEDPFNYGQSVRALYAAGAAGLVIRPRTWRGGDGVIMRSSAGATDLMPTALIDDPTEAITRFRAAGYVIAATARDRRAQSIYDVDLSRPLFLLIGGEKRGLRRELLDTADLVLRIPYKRKFPHSLGSAGSSAVLAFELMRQRLGGRARKTADGASPGV